MENRQEAEKRGKKKRSIFFRMMVFSLIFGICAALFIFGANVYMMLTTRDAILTLEDAGSLDVDCVLVLGAGLRRDGAPSQMLADRLRVGIAAYEKGAADKMLMTGDHGREEYDEVNAMKTFAMDLGVPSSHIFMDHAGFSTYESMYRAKEIFEVEKVLIVTQHYHLYRAIYNARQMGIEAYGIPSDLRRYGRQTYFDFREYLARTKDFVWGIVRPLPTYLGEAIPIWGDGDATNDW